MKRLLTLLLITTILAGCKPAPNTWPSAPQHRYMNGLRSHSWIVPPLTTAQLDSLASYDFLSLGDLASTSYPALVDSLRSRRSHPLIYASYTFNRIWDYPNDNTPRRPVPAISRRVYDRLYPLHIAHLNGVPDVNSPYAAYGDTALATWANGAAEYVINWADPAVPELLASILADYVLTAPWRPDGMFLDWQEYPGSGWWILNGPGLTVDGDRDGVVGLADQDERNITYANWIMFGQLMHKKLGDNFFLFANAGSHGPLNLTSTVGPTYHVLAGLNGVMYEHFPYGWGSGNYVRKAFEYDGALREGFDSFRQYLQPPHTPTQRSQRSTPSGGYVFLDQILRPNFPYVAIMSLYCDGAIAHAGPFLSQSDEWDYFTDGPQPHYWHGDPFNGLKELGTATSEPYLTAQQTWRRDFEQGFVELRWNPRAILPLAPSGNITHSSNPTGPFDYRVVIDDSVRYSHLW